jgi:hypothetical protein
VPSAERQSAAPPAFKRLLLGAPPTRAPSHVRLRALVEGETAAAHALLDELGGEQLTLSMSLVCLERASELAPYDPSSQAAARILRMRLEELGELRDALQRVHFACAYPVAAPLLVKDAPLADYLRGVHAWLGGIARALEYLAVELRQLGADWSAFRARVAEAQLFYLSEMPEAVRADVASLAEQSTETPELLLDLGATLDDLFACAEWFAASINAPFG